MTEKTNKIIVLLLKIWIVLIFIGFVSISYINIKVSHKYEDSTYYYKVLNAPVRSMQFTPITEDTLYLKRLEQEYKRLIK